MRAAFEGPPAASVHDYHPDHGLAVGPTSVLMVTNNVVTLRRKSGELVAAKRARDLFASVVPHLGRPDDGVAGDPWMIFDPTSQRFFYVTDASEGNGHVTKCIPGACRAYHLLAVSKSADPRSLGPDDWHLYALDRTLLRTPDGVIETANWGDYDNVVADEETLLITWPAYAFGVPSGGPGQSQGAKVRILDKAKLLRGERIDEWTDLEFREPESGAIALEKVEPAAGSGGAVPFFFIGMRGCDVVVWSLGSPRAARPQLRRQTLRPAQPCAPPGGMTAAQPGGAGGIYINPYGHNVWYRNGSLWFSHLVRRDLPSGAMTATRWFQIDVSSWPGPARFVQDGTFEEGGFWHLAPAMAVDASGNVTLVYGRTGRTEYASLYYAFRLGTDAPNVLRPGGPLKIGAGLWVTSSPLLSGRNSWVDFYAAALDPVDGTAWVFGAYVTSDGERGTWVANLDVDAR